MGTVCFHSFSLLTHIIKSKMAKFKLLSALQLLASSIPIIFADMDRFTDMYIHLHSQHSLANTVAAGLETAIQEIDGYGCWCKFGAGSKGKGAPINSIDSMCKL